MSGLRPVRLRIAVPFELRLVGGSGEKIQGLRGGKFDVLGGGGIGGDFFEKERGVLVLKQTKSDEGNNADLGILVPGGGPEGGNHPRIHQLGDRLHTFDPLDPQRIGDLLQQHLGAAAVVQPDQGQSGNDLGGAVGRFQAGKVGFRFGFVGELQKRAAGKAADVAIGVLEHFEKVGNQVGIPALAQEAGSRGAGEPVGVLGGGAEDFDGLLGFKNPGGLGGLAADGGVGILEPGLDEGTGARAGGRIEGEGLERVGPDGGQTVFQGATIGLGLGIQTEDLAGLAGGDFRLPEKQGEMQAFLAEGGAIGSFFEGGVDQRAGFLKAAGFEKFVGATGVRIAGAGAAREAEDGQ